MLINGNGFEGLPKFLEASEHRFQVLKEIGFNMTTAELRDARMADLTSRGKD